MEPDQLTDHLKEAIPIATEKLRLDRGRAGLIIVDEVNGFATVGAGNLAPPKPDRQVDRMIAETDRLARAFAAKGWPVFAFLDTHESDIPEPPYPLHCVRGTGEDELVPMLKWLEGHPATTLVRKDCINGFVGAIEPDGSNRVTEWVNEHALDTLLVVGICTDICIMDFVLTMLSARNHKLMPTVREIAVYEAGCATYDLSKAAAVSRGLPETAAHPQALTHYMGLYFMSARGARIAREVLVAG